MALPTTDELRIVIRLDLLDDWIGAARPGGPPDQAPAPPPDPAPADAADVPRTPGRGTGALSRA